MAQGQAADLAWDERTSTLNMYWRVAGSKSGEFFALACRAGAMLGTNGQAEVDSLAAFGYHLGVLVQLSDDWQALREPRSLGDLTTLGRTLPVVYALEVTPPESRERLHTLLRAVADDPATLPQLQAALVDSGALHYSALQAARQHYLARKSLLSLTHPSVAQHELLEMLDAVFPAVARTRWTCSKEHSEGDEEHSAATPSGTTYPGSLSRY